MHDVTQPLANDENDSLSRVSHCLWDKFNMVAAKRINEWYTLVPTPSLECARRRGGGMEGGRESSEVVAGWLDFVSPPWWGEVELGTDEESLLEDDLGASASSYEHNSSNGHKLDDAVVTLSNRAISSWEAFWYRAYNFGRFYIQVIDMDHILSGVKDEMMQWYQFIIDSE